MGAPIYEGYGQTEAGPILTYNGPQGSRAGSVGRPVPGTEVEVVDLETGAKPLLAGQRGEIRARGPQIMQGYLARPRPPPNHCATAGSTPATSANSPRMASCTSATARRTW